MPRYLITIWENNDGPAEMPVQEYYANAVNDDAAERQGYNRAKREGISGAYVNAEEVAPRAGYLY